jgi:hypothetical protein
MWYDARRGHSPLLRLWSGVRQLSISCKFLPYLREAPCTLLL